MNGELVAFIKDMGFPIAAFLLIYLDLRKEVVKLRETLEELCLKLNKE